MFDEMIQCALIDLPVVDAKKRSFSKEFATNLAATIDFDGQLLAIGVRPNPEKPGRFILVHGRHRLFAIHKVLKHELIRATVLHDMDESMAASAMNAENLWRNPLKKAQHLMAIREWHAKYAAQHPQKVGRGQNLTTAGRAEKASDAAAAASKPTVGLPADGEAESEAEAEPDAAPEPTPPVVQNFAEQVSVATGESISQAKVSTKIATTFDEEQLEVFLQMQVSKLEMEAVAKIKDKEQRDEVVNLVASGMDTIEAIVQVTKPASGTVKLGNGQVKGQKVAPEVHPDTALTDLAWAELYCGAVLKLLTYKDAYLGDVALYRALIDHRQTFREAAKKPLAYCKKGPKGAFFRAVAKVVNIVHPADWLVCSPCRGSGSIDGKKCGECYGDAFVVRTEGQR